MILCPVCPLCGHAPAFVLTGEVQAFCANNNCPTMCWNPSETAAANLRVDVADLAREDAGPTEESEAP